MQMISIREASRFTIGAEILRREALRHSEGQMVTFDHVAGAILRPDADGQKLRDALEQLAKQEANWLRNTPPHTLKTDRVMQSREAEIRMFKGIGAAVIATIEHAEAASMQDTNAQRALHDAYQGALEVIDNSPGSAQDKLAMQDSLKQQATSATEYGNEVIAALNLAETAYLEAQAEQSINRWNNTLTRSNDFDM
jgi:ribosomal protein L14